MASPNSPRQLMIIEMPVAQGEQSLSTIEKRLNQIKESLGFIKNEQLIAYCKDRKII